MHVCMFIVLFFDPANRGRTNVTQHTERMLRGEIDH